MAVARLALHELWISFRLLLVVGAILLASLPAALLPSAMTPTLEGAPPDALGWYAIAIATALTLAAVIAAVSIAAERRRGTAGWLAARAVPRSTILVAWFATLAAIAGVAMVPTGLVGWLSLENALPPTGPLPFAAALLASTTAGIAAISLGLLAGSLLHPIAAGAATVLLAGPPLVGAATGQFGWAAVPGGGLSVLAGLATEQRPIAESLLAAGVALAVAALLLLAALAAYERADL